MIIKKDKRTNYLRQQFLDAIERLKAKKPQIKAFVKTWLMASLSSI